MSVAGDWHITKGKLRRSTYRRERWTYAVHEAGHAVIAECLGMRVESLELGQRKNGDWFGWCSYREMRKRRRVDSVQRACIAIAGHEAEVFLTGRPIDKLPHGDVVTIHRLGLSDHSMNCIGWLVRPWIRRLAPEIRRVAKALVVSKTGTLTRRQFLGAYRGV